MIMDSFLFGGGFEVIFFTVFVLVLGIFIVIAVKGIGEWHKNNQSPRLTVSASVVAKRVNLSHHAGTDQPHMSHMSHTSTRYYVTFQVESGDRMELRLSGHEYGMLAEGDQGQLTFQGTRYLHFDRIPQSA